MAVNGSFRTVLTNTATLASEVADLCEDSGRKLLQKLLIDIALIRSRSEYENPDVGSDQHRKLLEKLDKLYGILCKIKKNYSSRSCFGLFLKYNFGTVISLESQSELEEISAFLSSNEFILPAQHPTVLPVILPGYRLIESLGQNRRVWLAEDTASGIGRRVVVRVGQSPGEHLRREVEIMENLSRVNSPNVVAYLHCLCTADGTTAVVFGYVAGEPLSNVLANQPNGRLPWRLPSDTWTYSTESSSQLSILVIIMGVLRGLTALHTAEPPIMHCALTPAKILVCNGRAVLIDFRMSVIAGSPPSPHSGAESSHSRYMSPEQVAGADEAAVDARSDVWAAGVILHEMLSGQPLFAKVAILASITRLSTN